jgi:hypothetical protein
VKHWAGNQPHTQPLTPMAVLTSARNTLRVLQAAILTSLIDGIWRVKTVKRKSDGLAWKMMRLQLLTFPSVYFMLVIMQKQLKKKGTVFKVISKDFGT